MTKLAIICTHPIQYYSPVFKLLATKINLKVFYTAGNPSVSTFDLGFQQRIEWDIPLLDGYEYEYLENSASDRGSHHFFGIKTPTAISKITAYQPTAIFVYGWAYVSHIKILNYFKKKIPIYFRGDSTLLDAISPFKQLIKTILLKWVYSHVDYAFYTGTANESYFTKYGLRSNQLIFAPHAIDNDRFEFAQPESVSLRKKLGINSTSIIILFAGKLMEKKDPGILLDAFLKLDNPDVYLLFVGNGNLEKKLIAHSKSSVKSDKIHFMGFQNQQQMPLIYHACDLFCLPSKGPGESWGLAVNEAMACSKGVLVSDKVGCAIDLVGSNSNGTIFRSENILELINKLSILCENKSELQRMGKRSKEIICQWTIQIQVDAIANTIIRNEASS